jgi:hypothetical protein
MSVEVLLNRLEKVKKTSKNSWRACCPAHRGMKQSLSIRDDNGKVLAHCFAEGCSFIDVLDSLGLTVDDIQPRLPGEHKPLKRPFYAGDVLQISQDEMFVAYLISKRLLDGTATYNDTQRLLTCVSRLGHAVEMANG